MRLAEKWKEISVARQKRTTIEAAIEEKIGEVRTDAFDLSFGEITSLYKAEPREFEISPDFQRFFRWSEEQQSRLIESILLELPIPQIFVIENDTGVIELIDGLQRISSVIHFIEPSLLQEPNNTPLVLSGCDIITELNGKTFDELPLSLRFRIKRSSVRAVVIKRQSTPTLRYSMFKRLNTGGSELSHQEVRNCTSRMAGDNGSRFYTFLQECARHPDFAACTDTLSQIDKDQRQDEELVLRFFALKNAQHMFKGNIRDWLDDYMEAVIFGKSPFQYSEEKEAFSRLFHFLNTVLGDGAFVKYREDKPIGGLAPAYFEAVSVGTWRTLTRVENDVAPALVKGKIIETVQSDEFRSQVGPGANSMQKLRKRVELIQSALAGLGT
jgi:hypothetical protein